MANKGSYSQSAVAYAQALIDLAGDKAGEIAQELAAMAQLMGSDPMFRAFFSEPGITPAERKRVLDTAIASASELFRNFMGVLNEKERLPLLAEISLAYRDLLDRKENRVRVELTVAQKLEAADLVEVQQRISKALGKTASIEQKIDDSIIGGLVLRVEDKIIDASVKSQLHAMKQQLLSAPVKS